MSHIDDIQARVDAATGGPWEATSCRPWSSRQQSPFDDYGASIDDVVVGGAQYEQGGAVGILLPEDAQFIAHARADVPWLLEAVRLLRVLCVMQSDRVFGVNNILSRYGPEVPINVSEAMEDARVAAREVWADYLAHEGGEEPDETTYEDCAWLRGRLCRAIQMGCDIALMMRDKVASEEDKALADKAVEYLLELRNYKEAT